jgi:hypothetical protein
MSLSMFLIIAIVTLVILFKLIKWFFEGYRGNNLKNKYNTKHPTIINEKPKFHLKKITEINTTYEPAGTEERIVDNLKSNGLVRRRLTISKEWKKTISLNTLSSNSLTAKAGIPYLTLEVEQMLQNTYNVSFEETKYFSEEVELEIGAHSKIVLNINWKTIWQNGEIELETSHGEHISIPFKVAKGITFDQIQEKTN